MSARLSPYLQFKGNAAEAMTFYQSVFGGELNVMRFADLGGMGLPDEGQQQVMHSDLTVSEGFMLMGADVPDHFSPDARNGHQALSGDGEATLKGWFEGLADGGTIDVPLEKAPWGDWFGQVKDKYGIDWMVNIAGS